MGIKGLAKLLSDEAPDVSSVTIQRHKNNGLMNTTISNIYSLLSYMSFKIKCIYTTLFSAFVKYLFLLSMVGR